MYSKRYVFFLTLLITVSSSNQITQSIDTQGQPHWDTSDTLTSQMYLDWNIGENGTLNSTHAITDVYTSGEDLLYDISIYFDESNIPFYPAGSGLTETRYDVNSTHYNYYKVTENYIPPTTAVSGYRNYEIELIYEEKNGSRLDLKNMEPGIYYISSFQTFNKSYVWPEPNPYPEYAEYELSNVSIIEKYTISRQPITIKGKNYWTYKCERLNYYSEVFIKRVYNLGYSYYELDTRYYNEDQTILTVEYIKNYYSLSTTVTLDFVFSTPFLYDKCTWYEEVIGYPLVESDPWFMNYDPIEINETSNYGSVPVATLFKNTTVTTFNNQFLFYYTTTETVTEVSDHTVTDTITETNEITQTNTSTVTKEITTTETTSDVVTTTEQGTATVLITSMVELTTEITNMKSEARFNAMFFVVASLTIIGYLRRRLIATTSKPPT